MPILGEIVSVKYTKPFAMGIYSGNQKPTIVNIFLKAFVEEYNEIGREGIQLNNENVSLSLNAVICDAPAKAFISGVKYHSGYFGCSKCTIEGDFIDNRVVFLDTHCRLRTDTSFRLRLQDEHHKSKSILEDTKIGMVSQLPLDYMHLICLGVSIASFFCIQDQLL